MDLTYAFRLPVPVDEAWATLSDLPRVADHLPGAMLDSVTGDIATGQLTVKVGPVSVRYDGALTVQSQDAAGQVAVLRAKGTETRGDGDAAATVTVALTGDGGDATIVTVAAVLEVTGRIARFGRGVLDDVGARMVGQLAASLDGELVDVPVPVPDAEVDDAEPVAPVIPPPPGAPGGEIIEVIEVVEVEMVETELGDPFGAVEPDDADLDPAPAIDLDDTDPAWLPEPEPDPVSAVAARGGASAGTWSAGPPAPASSSTARKVGPILAGIAVLWLLKKLLSRSKR